MPNFENPSHRAALQRLGILLPEEITVSNEVFAERLSQSDAIEEALSLLRQEIIQPITLYGFIESSIAVAHAAAEAIQDEITLAQAIEQFQNLARLPAHSEQLANDLLHLADLLATKLTPEQYQSLSQAALKDLQRIVSLSGELQKLVQEKQAIIHHGLAEINALIQQRSRNL